MHLHVRGVLFLAGLAISSISWSASAQVPFEIPATAEAPSRGTAENTEHEVKGYCQYIQAVGQSTSALLISPSVFATFSNVPTSSTGADNGLFGASRARLQLGVGLSPTRMYRGALTGEIAKAECRRYAAEARTPRYVAPSFERPALFAKIQVLQEAVARARVLRQQLVAQLETSLATVEEYSALSLQQDSLERDLAEASGRLALLPPPPVESPSVAPEREAAEDAAQSAQARMRRSQALELELRGGYYRIFGQEQKLPVFAIATLEFTPGWLWQGPYEERAAVGHRAWVRARTEQVGLSPEQRVQLHQAKELAQERSKALAETLNDLEARRSTVQGVGGQQARHFADVMWLQLASLRAEQAYLVAYSAALERELNSHPGG